MSILSIVAPALAIPCAFALTRGRQIYRHSIVSEHGIQECGYVTLGGIRQYVQIRGQDKRNPIILFLHGGPGNPTSCLSYHYQKELEHDFTLVNWDQRGCGRTFYENRGKDGPVTITQILSDLDELIDYLLQRFGAQRLILLGYSWGTVPGILYAKLHPEKLECYLSVCQCVHILSGSVYAAAHTAAQAKQQGDLAYAELLEQKIDHFTHREQQFTKNGFADYTKLRDVTCAYQKSKTCKSLISYFQVGLLSPDCHLRDLRWKMRQLLLPHAYFAHEGMLIEYLSMQFDLRSLPPEFRVPVYFLTADDDRICPADMIEEYYCKVSAPNKKLLRLKAQTHTLFFDEPEVFCNSVKKLLQAT
ncbi:MAG: alpha/beta hydrolase [Clostridia bacterium]|nr:alpha/beta hydrolase [Clostridia bacterium]